MSTMTTSLGAFSISLAVKDLAASKAFYAQLGFEVVGGQAEHKYLIMKNGVSVIGLFQGLFDRNILTFNPGWDQACGPVDGYTNVHALKDRLAALGPVTAGDKSFTLTDPDGNPILVDQHA